MHLSYIWNVRHRISTLYAHELLVVCLKHLSHECLYILIIITAIIYNSLSLIISKYSFIFYLEIYIA